VIIPIKNDNLTETLNHFFKELMEKNVIDALILPQSVLNDKTVSQTLIKNVDSIISAQPFLPVLMNNGATIVSYITKNGTNQKVGVVLRACEIRALIELAKFKQVNLDNLFLIGVDCIGTMEARDFAAKIKENKKFSGEMFNKALFGGDDSSIRTACRVCTYPIPENVDLKLGFIGMDNKEIYVEASDEVADLMGWEKGNHVPEKRTKAVEKIKGDKEKIKEEFLKNTREKFKSISDLLNEFARCKRCFNCRVECPICYCKECVFMTNVFDHDSNQYYKWAERKGAIKLPYDTLLYHLTRLNHMATSCIGCGQCSSACPNDLPVFELFQLIGKEVQGLFDYEAGKSREDDPPLVTFKEEELEPL